MEAVRDGGSGERPEKARSAKGTPVAPMKGPMYGYLLLSAALTTFALIVVGSVVRVTGSGLGCGTDWPLCNGQLIPPLEFEVLIEYFHRLLASVVLVLTSLALVGAWWKYRQRRGVLLPVSLAFLFLVLQVALGAVTVILELPPLIVAIHLSAAQGIFSFLLIGTVMTWRAGSAVPKAPGGPLFRRALIGALASYVLIVSGAYVVASGSTGACASWPLCQGDSLIPSGELQSIHMLHRLLAALLSAAIIWAAWGGWRERRQSAGIRAASGAVITVLAAEVLVGALNPWLGFLASIRTVHLALATALGGSLVALAALTYLSESGRSDVEDQRALEGIEQEPPTLRQMLTDYLILTKPWIMALLLLTALGGMVLAAGGLPSWPVLVSVLLGGGLASGGASALNHFMDQDVDQKMKRTRLRPVASRRIPPHHALIFGVTLNVLAFAILWAGANLLAALLTMGGSVFYVLVYTGWLKRSTTQNIVIGGAAGAIPPVVGWAAVTGGLSLPALYLFAIVFYWTPPHFWALALLIQRDYAEARVPMLPVVEGEDWTRRAIFLYTLIVSAVTLLLYVATQSLGPLYLGGAVVLGGLFIYFALQLVRLATRALAARVYTYSLVYLAALFLVIMVDSSF